MWHVFSSFHIVSLDECHLERMGWDTGFGRCLRRLLRDPDLDRELGAVLLSRPPSRAAPRTRQSEAFSPDRGEAAPGALAVSLRDAAAQAEDNQQLGLLYSIERLRPCALSAPTFLGDHGHRRRPTPRCHPPAPPWLLLPAGHPYVALVPS